MNQSMLSRDKILRETSPLSIFFVKSGSSGNRLLFRYPYDENFQDDPDLGNILAGPINDPDRLQFQSVIAENDEALCNVFSVNPNLCGKKFEIKISSVRHVGHPMSLLANPSSPTGTTDISFQQPTSPHRISARQPIQSYSPHDSFSPSNRNYNGNQSDTTSFNIVCALRSSASYDIVDCYHDLSKRLAIALSYEERRCSYLSKEIKTIMTTLEERDMVNLRDQQDSDHLQPDEKNGLTLAGSNLDSISTRESVFSLILNRSHLARDLKSVFVCLTTTGIVDLKINNWISVSFCLPQKVHRLKLMTHKLMPAISTKDIKRCLMYLRPYHGLLLLQKPQELLDSLPIDASPAFIQLIRVTKPDKNFMDLSVDANLSLMQIFCIVSQLVYWAKATIIYPICGSNTYAIHPLASIGLKSKLAEDFKVRFPKSNSIHHYLADFSERTSLSQMNASLMDAEEKLNLLNIVTWLLQRRILIQVHKYIFLVVEKSQDNNRKAHTTDTLRADRKSASSRVTDYAKSPINTNGDVSQIHDNIAATNVEIGSVESSAGRRAHLINSSFGSSPQILKSSLSESYNSQRWQRTDSLAESQDSAGFEHSSSLSSTPNSNLEYPSPSNDAQNKSSLSNSCPSDNPLNSMGGSNSILTALQKAGLSGTGAKYVQSLPASANSTDLQLLLKLIPYFDGKHHVEDIMFSENLERSQVLSLCDKFRDILYTCHHEDVAVSQLSPFTSAR